MSWAPLASLWIVLTCANMAVSDSGNKWTRRYSNEWVVRVEGGPEVARMVSRELGYECLGQVTGFKDTYRLTKADFPVQRKRNQVLLTERLLKDSRVIWAEQQFAKRREKRDMPLDIREYLHRLLKEEESSGNQTKMAAEQPKNVNFNDELWNQQWYLQDTRTQASLPKLDLHVLPVYQMGITGKGVRVLILDDGIEYTHEDLRDNYDPDISYDANDEDEDPFPRMDEEGSNAHGTRCAGEVAMKANNRKCGVGVAFNAKVGGIRLLDGEVNDRIEGIALGYAHDKVDIYSASWGPTDDGKTVEGPGRLAREAIERGITEGRNGKGVIYVWAGGNGGSKDDNCECDGYIGSIYTLSIGSASQHGQFPWYGEKCAATMATTYSSGAYADQMIATTDIGNTCTIKHTGTSASAPLAAGIIALALEANPELTWRDLQHLVVWTSEYAPLSDNEGWLMNAAGHWVNTRFGYGLMNADSLVRAAANWTNVPEKYICSIEAGQEGEALYFGKDVELSIDASVCDFVYYLEHVELEINIAYPVRGDLEIFLESPSGTNIQLLNRRKNDGSRRGFRNWRLMSVLTWNENPRGVWKVLVTDRVGSSRQKGKIGKFTLHLHGVYERPRYLESGRRQYDDDYNRVHRKMAGDFEEEEEQQEEVSEGMLTTTPTATEQLSPSPQSRRESWASIASSRRNSRVLQNDLLLHEAVLKNEAETVAKILKDPVDVNSRNNYGRAPIHWASSRGSTEIMQMLIDAKCNIEAQDKYGMRPILMAAWHGHKDAARLLIEAGADVNAVNKKQYTVLMCAAKNNRMEVMSFLEEALGDVRVDEVDAEGQTALHHAASGGHVESVKRLIEMGAMVNCPDKENRTPLHCAAEKGHVDVVEVLLLNGAAIDALDKDGNTPLHLSALARQTRVAQLLLNHDSPPDIPNHKGQTALHLASDLGCRGIIDSLLRHGAVVNVQTKTGNTPLHLACRRDEPEVVELLLSGGAEVNRVNLRLESAIHVAAEHGLGEICQLLLAAGANIEQKEQVLPAGEGKTALYVAARGSFTAIVDMIIKTARLDYSSEEESKTEVKTHAVKRTGKPRQQPDSKEDNNEMLRSLFYSLAYKQLEKGDWKAMAEHWAFSQEQIKAIEHQCAGEASYKEHGFRMMLIWAHGLGPGVNPVKELQEALLAVGNRKAADALKKSLNQDGRLKQKSKSSCSLL